METSLRGLSGRSFKLFLKRETTSRAKAITAGAIATAVLQSSSIINLLVLSMVGAGVVQMENALAIMLGSNLGTTLNSWIVALFGFNYNIETLALPFAGFAGIIMAFSNRESRWFLWLQFIFSIAFLFIGLGFIKNGMESFTLQTDLPGLRDYPLVVFLAAGILLTTLIQSSSATMAITLSALHTHNLELIAAMAIALGSETGTTFKLFLASAGGLAVKKRVALGNFLFNFISTVAIFLLLTPVHYLIVNVLRIQDNLIALVFFQSFVNICGILLFSPFLPWISKFLLKRYTTTGEESFYISKVPVADTDLAQAALEDETKHFIHCVVDYSCDSFRLEKELNFGSAFQKGHDRKTLAEKYDYIKQLHGEMHGFCLKVQNANLAKKDSERLNQLVSSIRNTMYAAKNIRDAQHDIDQMRNSSNEIKYNFYSQSRKILQEFSLQAIALVNRQNQGSCFGDLAALYQSITAGYTEALQMLYKESLVNRVNEMEISTLINFNRQLFTYFKSLLFGLKDYLLAPKETEYFDSLPGFIR
jgi:phosphate:Na+ symporter